jgi:class 3 adenylate cyclase
MLKPFHYQWEWLLAATPEQLWPLVSDTNRFNRDAGVPAVEEPHESQDEVRRLKLKRYGVTIEWDEQPFEWMRPRSFGVLRTYHRGPVREMRVHTELLSQGEATLLRYQVTAWPRNPLGRVAIPFEIGLVSARRFGAVFREYARIAAQSPPSGMRSGYRLQLAPGPLPLAAGGNGRLASGLAALLRAGINAGLCDQLRDLIERADDAAVGRIEPYLLADVWEVPRQDAVRLCLEATRAGLLDLQWDLLCPLCRGARDTTTSLRDLPNGVHCSSCHIDFAANFEQSVELTFRVNSSIRHVEVFSFCVGGPQLTPHIVAQQLLEPGEARELRLTLEPGRHRIRSPGLAGVQLIDVADKGAAVISFAPRDGWQDAVRNAATSCVCVLTNAGAKRRLMIIERVAWSDYALTAAEVTAMQDFRDLFSSEALRPGETINVGNMAILFTDLRASTRLYQDIGDAPAFGRVLSHFDALRAAMQDEDGALIKTIGDAVMAVFRRPANALRTILRAHEILAGYPAGVQPQDLKAGIHFGPCIGVTLNERLDYFGSTVNIAARLDALADGGDIIISQAVAADPEVAQFLHDSGVAVENFEANLKGYEQALQLLRIKPGSEKVLAS